MAGPERSNETSEARPARPGNALARTRPRLDVRTARALLLGAILIMSILAYNLALARFDVQEEPLEAHYGVAANDAAIRVYLQPMSVDAANGSMQVRISVLPEAGEAGVALTTAKRDMLLAIHHDGRTDQLTVRSGQPFPEAMYRIDLQQGSVRDYPLDRYKALVRLICFDAGPGGDRAPLPIHLTTWEGILGYALHGAQEASSKANDLELSLDVQRTGAFAFFGFVAYAAMIVMGLSALTIGAMVFIGVRTVEVTLVGAVGSMIFALFAMRQALPGSPPLGIRADVLVFFWAQLATAFSLCLFMIAWATRGSSGPPPMPRPPA